MKICTMHRGWTFARGFAIAALVASAAGSVLCSGGCAIKANNRVKIEGVDTIKLGALAVDVDLTRGSVEVTEDATVKTPDVIVLRTDGQGPRNLEHIESFVACQLVPGDYGSVLRIVSADTARGEAPHFLIKVRVPTCDGLRIRTGDGSVRALGIGGAIDISTSASSVSTGFVYVETERALNQPISIQTGHGDVTLMMPASSAVSVSAESPKGWSKLTTDTARVMTGTTKSVHAFTATISGGGAPVELKSGEGNVHVIVK